MFLKSRFAGNLGDITCLLFSSTAVKTCGIIYVRSQLEEKAILLCKVLIREIIFPVTVIVLNYFVQIYTAFGQKCQFMEAGE